MQIFIETVKINKFATRVHVKDCLLPSQVTKHLIDQLRGCNDLRQLVLSQLEFPDNLGDTIASTSSLEAIGLIGTLETGNGRLLAGLSHSQMLRILVIHGCTLSDQVPYLFGDHDLPRFRQLKVLSMADTELSKVDLKSISSAVTNGKLPLLDTLNLSGNVLINCVTDLLHNSNQSGFLYLKYLYLSNAKLGKSDLDSIAVAVQCDKLPKVELLDLSDNVLTDILSTLIPPTADHGFLNLKNFNLDSCQLSTTDLEILANSIHTGKLPKLYKLDLSNNILTNWLSYLLEIKSKGRPLSLCNLLLENTQLNKDDVYSISRALTLNTLPKLKLLILKENSLCSAEMEVEMLIQSSRECILILHRQNMKLDLRGNNFSQKFTERMDHFHSGPLLILIKG